MKRIKYNSKGEEVVVVTGGDDSVEDNLFVMKMVKAKDEKATQHDKLDYIIELLESR